MAGIRRRYPPAKCFLLFLLAAYISLSDGRPNHSVHLVRTHELMRLRSERILASLTAGNRTSLSPPSKSLSATSLSRVFSVTNYGADPTGIADSTDAIKLALAAASRSPENHHLMSNIDDLGGSELDLGGGTYLISSPIVLTSNPVGNLKFHSGSLRASDNFPADSYVIELRSNSSQSGGNFNSEFVTLSGIMVDANNRGGGISVLNSLRTTIIGCYIVHFSTDGIYVNSGHETLITNSFIGQHITAGGSWLEKQYSGTGIRLNSNDNVITDVIIFSAAVGILIAGQANTLTGVHCYNKATSFGGTGIYLKLPGMTQTRITNCYLDFTSIVAEDPVQLYISGSFFLGDANVVLKSMKGVMRGVEIVGNMFDGRGTGVSIVRLDETFGPFTAVDGVVVGRNSVEGMHVKSTRGKASVSGNGTMWTVDFKPLLLFPNRIDSVQYALLAGSKFPGHALRSVSENRVVIESDVAVQATVYVQVEQCGGIMMAR